MPEWADHRLRFRLAGWILLAVFCGLFAGWVARETTLAKKRYGFLRIQSVLVLDGMQYDTMTYMEVNKHLSAWLKKDDCHGMRHNVLEAFVYPGGVGEYRIVCIMGRDSPEQLNRMSQVVNSFLYDCPRVGLPRARTRQNGKNGDQKE